MSEQEFRDHLIGQVYLHPNKPQAYQIVGWMQRTSRDHSSRLVLFMKPVFLEHIYTRFAEKIYKIKQTDIQRPVSEPIHVNNHQFPIMTFRRVPNEDGTITYTIKDVDIPLIHCPQSSVPFILYCYKTRINGTFEYNGCHLFQGSPVMINKLC
jgi:hypothetical protein